MKTVLKNKHIHQQQGSERKILKIFTVTPVLKPGKIANKCTFTIREPAKIFLLFLSIIVFNTAKLDDLSKKCENYHFRLIFKLTHQFLAIFS